MIAESEVRSKEKRAIKLECWEVWMLGAQGLRQRAKGPKTEGTGPRRPRTEKSERAYLKSSSR